MTIQPIGAASVALYLTPEDLRKHGLTPESLTRDRALALSRDAFAQAGMHVEGDLEIEAYPDVCGVLLFARGTPPRRRWFVFEDLEELLRAARTLFSTGPCPDAALVLWEDRYWLRVPAGAEESACRLSEFGSTAQPAPFLDARLGEHGVVILPERALATLLRYFPD